MTRIGINGGIFCAPDPAGVPRFGIEITKRLSQNNHDITVFSHATSKEQLDDIPIDTFGYLTPSRWFGLLWGQSVLPLRASTANIDVLYSPTTYCPLIPTSFPCAITIHDVSSLRGQSSKWYNKFEERVLPQLTNRADLIFTVSEFSKQEIHTVLGVPKSDIQVIYNGVSDFFRSNETVDTDLPLPDNYILYVGSLGTRKNISSLIESFHELKRSYDIDHELVLVGPENDVTNETNIDTENLGAIEDSVTQFGYITDRQLKDAYSSADLFVFPSLYEGFGIPPLEAMACETPVVSSNRTAMPEILGDAAKFTNPDDTDEMAESIYSVLTDTELRRNLINRGRKRTAKFTWEKSAKRLSKALASI